MTTVQPELKKYTTYDLVTGQVLTTFSYTSYGDDPPFEASAGEGFVEETVDGSVFYLPGGVKTERVKLSVSADKDTISADDVDTVLLTNIPAGTKAIVNRGAAYIIDDGILEYSTGNPGPHMISFELFPFLSQEIYIHAS